MLKKRLLPLALFLALILCASCACAAAFPYVIPQTELTEWINENVQNAPDSDYSLRIGVPDKGSLSALKSKVNGYRSNSIREMLSACGYDPSQKQLVDFGWSDITDLPAYSARLPVVGADGQAYNIVVKGVLVDLSIVDEAGNMLDDGEYFQDFSHSTPFLSIRSDTFAALTALTGLTTAFRASSAPIVAMDIVHFVKDKDPDIDTWIPKQVSFYDYNFYSSLGYDSLGNLHSRSDFPEALVQTKWVEGGSFADLQAAHDKLINSPIKFTLQGFSPYLFMWVEYEPVAGAPALPETGDSSSLAQWLVLLGGACALLLLSRRSRHA